MDHSKPIERIQLNEVCGNYCSIRTTAREQKEIYLNSTDLQFWWCAKGRPFLAWLCHRAGRLKCRISVSDRCLQRGQEVSVLHGESTTGGDIGRATPGTHSCWILPRLKCHTATLNDTCWESKTIFLTYLAQACFSTVLGDDGLTGDRISTHRCCKILLIIRMRKAKYGRRAELHRWQWCSGGGWNLLLCPAWKETAVAQSTQVHSLSAHE